MKELALKYGCNPNQAAARIYMRDGGELPLEVMNGRPGYINLLDAFNSWQLVKELKEATGLAAATSFKHVSPAGAAVAVQMSDALKKIYYVDDLPLSPQAAAYACARGADRMSSYGDFAALSDVCDAETAALLKREVSDGVIAPAYTDEALRILKEKRKGTYCVLKIDASYVPAETEHKEVFGVMFEQNRNNIKITTDLFTKRPTRNRDIPAAAQRDLLIALITLKYTQSNSVCYVKDGMTVGVGAGQQSRVHCTRLAGNKADIWWLRQHPKVLALPFKAVAAARSATIRLMYIFPMIMKTFLPTACGRPYLRTVPNRSRGTRKRRGLKSCAAWLSAAMRFSLSATISNGLIAVAWPILRSRAALSVMIMLLQPVINIISPWP
ncbi:phosphoribosylaminoimidazolecarboxamide formyltransferase [Anaeroglobus geminatus]|nr:phosphoribosylaminoimidazolecarboxamide formyltransferase [Anaeroglobus geminatus]